MVDALHPRWILKRDSRIITAEMPSSAHFESYTTLKKNGIVQKMIFRGQGTIFTLNPDEAVKSRNSIRVVIPAKAGIL
jgi:hypothetical protein